MTFRAFSEHMQPKNLSVVREDQMELRFQLTLKSFGVPVVD